MEIPENENALNTYEPKIESNDNGIDEIEICSYLNCCLLFIFVTVSIVSLWCPFVFYFLLIHIPLRKVVAIDKRTKTLILGGRGIIKCCCSCCISDRKTYFLNEIKNVKIQVTSIKDPKVGFGKLYFINGYIYSQNDECETLFSNIEYTNETYNKLVSFFQKYIQTIDEPLEMIKNGSNDVPIDRNDMLNKPSPNEDAAMPIAS